MRTPLISASRRVKPASLPPASVAPGDNLRGATLMTLSMVVFACNDTIIKFVAREMPLFQAVTLRGLFVLIGVALVAQRAGGLRLRIDSAARGPMILRLIGEVASTVLFLSALTHMAIGDLSAVMQALPLTVMLGASIFFGERMGWRRTLAVLVGLMGVLMILRPGSGTFGIWSLVALAAMLMVALRDLSTRRFGRHVSSETIAFYAAFFVTLTGFVLSLPDGWVMPTVAQVLLLMLGACFLTVGYVTAVSSMRVGEIGAVAPFRYTSLVAAIILGLIVFGEWPDLWTWTGSGLVVAAGVYSIWRERRLAARGKL
ncbi:DMT family transporter [Paracoccus sp. TK19116]|uniref:DMT family transporter n=1 Tax=Paracoccus albicereus TaxID=2922394 RepID=A0ABT1MXB9_9RHOB|nr:DMT family transporter [Paracoccus albicereus]MCQ0972156.1 DMT family transporter [Paracoccus albicereus]